MGKFQKQTEKKTVGKYIRLGILAVLIALLAVMPMLASRRKAAEGSQASILSATVEYKDIETQIIGGGQLSSAGSLNIRIPENVKLTEYLVGNGDTVKKGEPIARVDKVSVMTAITEVQETLDYLAAEIAAAGDDTASTSVRALAGGTVKVIYAKEGESVQDVMLDHGALAVLSLDDTMAVRIERESALDVGDPVCVTFSDGTEVDGKVKNNLNGVLTITMDDDDYSVGAKVTVTTEDGDRLGTGELYIFSPWSAAAYSGTISDVLVAENDTVAIGRVLFSLEDTGNSAQFQRLIDQRQEYEGLMQELFTMYRTEAITAPCDGIVTGVDEDGAYLLADHGNGWFVNLLSFSEKEQTTGFVAYAATVTEAAEGKTTLMIDPEAICIPDLAELSSTSADGSSMTEELDCSGTIPVYTQDAAGLLQNTGTAKTGDVLLAVGDEEQVLWFVDPDSGSDIQETSCTMDETCTADIHKDGCASQIPTDPEPEQPTVQITTTQLPNGTVGIAYHATLEASANGTWSAAGLPSDLTLDASTGAITGTPAEAGSYSVTVTFTYGENQTANTTFTLTITEDSADVPEENPTIRITTETLATGVAGQSYTYPLQVSGSTAGTWRAENLPGGLVINEQTGVISGTPSYEGTFAVAVSYMDTETGNSDTQEYTFTIVTAELNAYTGYVAQVVEIKDGWAKVKQTLYSYPIADLSKPPKVSASAADLSVDKEYTSDLIRTGELAVGDTFLIVVNNRGTVKLVSREAVQESQNAPGQQSGTNTGAAPSGGGAAAGGGMGGNGTVQSFEPYSLEKLTVAAVTSQEHMTVSITVDELDITKLYVGQAAVVSVDALGGEQFDAEITKISNSGENAGGNSKFTVEVTLGKSGDMLPGMYSSAVITLEIKENIPCVPVAALGKAGVDSILYTSYDAENGVLGNPVVVTIGTSDGENAEILDGLAAGEVCYYAYYDTYVGSDAPKQQGRSFNLGRILGR